jgi:hypothetical protein
VAIEDDPDVPHGTQSQPRETLGSAPKQTMGSAPHPAGPAPEEAFGGAPRTNQPGGDGGTSGTPLPPKTVDGGSPKTKPTTNVPLLVGIGVAILAIIAIIVSIAR